MDVRHECKCCRRHGYTGVWLVKASKRGAWKCEVCGTRYIRRLGFLREVVR